MNIIVLLKPVPDTESVIQIEEGQTAIDTADIRWVINPYDEYAIEEALRIKEAGGNVTVTAVSAGTATADDSLKTAYALGVDEAVRLDTTGLDAPDALTIATLLAAAIRRRPFDLILAGPRAVDTDNYQVPVTLATLLDLSLVCNVVRQALTATAVRCEQVTDGTRFQIEADLPAVLTTAKGLNEPRYPNMRAIMKARKMPVTVVSADDLGWVAGAENDRPVRTVSLRYPPARKQGRIIDGITPAEKAATLIELLKAETDIL